MIELDKPRSLRSSAERARRPSHYGVGQFPTGVDTVPDDYGFVPGGESDAKVGLL